MRVLFVSGELIAGDLALRMQNEGCDVKLFIGHPGQQVCLDGFIEKTKDWRNELAWVGKDGLIVFDDVGFGAYQNELRRSGYRVVGGSTGGDELEKNRSYGQKILAEGGMKTVPIFDFSSPDEAISFIRENPQMWVVKQNTHQSALNYVGVMHDGRDAIDILKHYERHGVGSVTLQERIIGIEVSINRYFNGTDWVGPSEVTLEHKSLFNDNLGPKTGEMGNLMWYDNGKNRLFTETLGRLTEHLRSIDFRGDIDINSFIREDQIFPIEITARFGCPITHSQSAMHISPWHEFLGAIADGKQYDLRHHSGYCVALTLALPPFPYEGKIAMEYSSDGLEVFFSPELNKEELNNVHFEGVRLEGGETQRYFITPSIGYTLFVSGRGETVAMARAEALSLARKVVIPKIFYRTDIGVSFEKADEQMLRSHNWIS